MFALFLMAALAWNTGTTNAQQIASPPSTGTCNSSNPLHSPASSPGSSRVTIAWLSDVKGDVQLADSAKREFRPASVSVPITKGTVIQTGMGRAEVEFEDNSTVRLGPYSLVEFPRLELLASGATASNVHVLKGTVYVSLIPAYIVSTKWNDFQLTFGQQSLVLQRSSHVRLELDPKEARLAVLDGTGQVDGPSGAIELVKKRTFTFSLKGRSKSAVVKKTDANPMDAWDRSAVMFHENNAKTDNRNGALFRPPLAAATSASRQ